MKALKVVAGIAVALACLYGFGRFFLAELKGGPTASGPPGVVLAAPPEYAVEEGGELGRAAAARELASLLARRGAEPRLGLHFTSGGFELYRLADRGAGNAGGDGGGLLTERAAGPGGVRTETVWSGGLAERLAWAAEHGSFDAPSLAPGERKNLYH
jgi:hypothetical protein